jgi:hypothetical protein
MVEDRLWAGQVKTKSVAILKKREARQLDSHDVGKLPSTASWMERASFSIISARVNEN